MKRSGIIKAVAAAAAAAAIVGITVGVGLQGGGGRVALADLNAAETLEREIERESAGQARAGAQVRVANGEGKDATSALSSSVKDAAPDASVKNATGKPDAAASEPVTEPPTQPTTPPPSNGDVVNTDSKEDNLGSLKTEVYYDEDGDIVGIMTIYQFKGVYKQTIYEEDDDIIFETTDRSKAITTREAIFAMLDDGDEIVSMTSSLEPIQDEPVDKIVD